MTERPAVTVPGLGLGVRVLIMIMIMILYYHDDEFSESRRSPGRSQPEAASPSLARVTQADGPVTVTVRVTAGATRKRDSVPLRAAASPHGHKSPPVMVTGPGGRVTRP